MSKAKLRAEAIDRFVTDAKAQGVYDSLKAACIMTGWDTLAGALTPLVGAAPTNTGFIAADYDRGGQGLKGDGAAKWLDCNRLNTADGQNDKHMSVYASQAHTSGAGQYPVYVGTGAGLPGSAVIGRLDNNSTTAYVRVNSASYVSATNAGAATGFLCASRNNSLQVVFRANATDQTYSSASESPYSSSLGIFRSAANGVAASYSNSRMSWYSIGSSVDLAALDTLVTRLMADLRAIEEDGMDRDALAYIRAVEAADGSFMVTGVKQAVDRLVKGLKYDRDANGRSAWDAIGASCLLCGPRTIAGALVPLKGVAPTAQGGWTSSDYNQETGLKGNGSTLWLDSNRANNADGQDDKHLAVYATSIASSGTYGGYVGAYTTSPLTISQVIRSGSLLDVTSSLNDATGRTVALTSAGLIGASRLSTAFALRADGVTTESTSATTGNNALNLHVFARNANGTPSNKSDARLAFYSIGASLSLSSLDSRITKYVNDVAAAIP